MMHKENFPKRLVFLDNTRFLMVFLVLILHVLTGYCSIVQWWPVVDNKTGPTLPFDLGVLIIVVFVMPVLFFVAGFFSLASLQKHGPLLFLKNKLKRIGIPLFLGVIFLAPVFNYIFHLRQSAINGRLPLTYFEHWIRFIKDGCQFHVGFVDLNLYDKKFFHAHFWFLTLLLLFFFFHGLIYYAYKKRGNSSSHDPQTSTDPSIIKGLLFLALTTTVIVFIMRFLVPSTAWCLIGFLFLFKPAHLLVYVSYFCFGIYTFHKKLFLNGKIFGRLTVWTPICIILSFLYIVLTKQIITGINVSLTIYAMQAVVKSFLLLSFLIIFTSFTFRFWNRPDSISQKLAANSYNIYIVHLVIVVLFQLLFQNWTGGHVIVKFLSVSVISMILSYGISNYLINPYPRISVAALLGLFTLLVTFLKPG